jgi:hypothetical protein
MSASASNRRALKRLWWRDLGGIDRWLLALAALHLLLKLLLAQTMLHVAPSGDELAYIDSAKALSNAVRDLVHLLPPDRVELQANVVGNGWFMPGMPLLLTPLYLLRGDAGIVAVRVYAGVLSLLLWSWTAFAVRRRLGPRYALALLVFPSLVPLWVMFSFTLWGDLYAGLLLVLLLLHAQAVTCGLRAGMVPGPSEAVALGALAAGVLYLRSSTLPLLPLLFGALLLAGWRFLPRIRHAAGTLRLVLAVATCAACLLPWSAAASFALRAPVATTTSVPLSLAITFGDANRLCFGRCEPGNVWLRAVGYSRGIAAATGTSEVEVQKVMARHALADLYPGRYAQLALGDFGRYLLRPAEFVSRFVKGRGAQPTRAWIGRTTQVFYVLAMVVWVAGLLAIFRRPFELQVNSTLVKLTSLSLLVQPLLHVSHGRYWPVFAPLMALSGGLLLEARSSRRQLATSLPLPASPELTGGQIALAGVLVAGAIGLLALGAE